MTSATSRVLPVASVAVAMLLVLGGCASAPATGTVRGVVRFEGGAASVPSTDPDTGSSTDTSPAAQCVAKALTQADLNSCVGLQAGSPAACSGSLADGSAVDAETEVDIVDTDGKLVGVGRLGTPSASPDGSACAYPFTATNVPTNHSIYGILLGPAAINTLGPESHFTNAETFGGKAVVEISR